MSKFFEYLSKNKLVSCLLLITLCAALTYCNSCSRFNDSIGWPHDHPLEEAIEDQMEDFIEDATGIRPEIDLTP